MSTEDSEIYVGTVRKICLDGKHGPYAVAFCKHPKINDWVTFSFSLEDYPYTGKGEPAWTERDAPERGGKLRPPKNGAIVVFHSMEKQAQGWRSDYVTPQTPASPVPASVAAEGGRKEEED